jgi:hypothetical protein
MISQIEKKKTVSFSGGRTSAYLCIKMIEKFGRENVDFIYMDTGGEHSKTYEFIKNVDSFFNLNLICLRGNFNQSLGKAHTYDIVDVNDIGPDLGPFKQMVGKYGTPTIASPWCTSRMKQEVHDKYCNDKYGKGNYQTWIGIRCDENKRLRNVGKSDKIRYLAEISDYEKYDILKYWSKMPFDLEINEWLGNCVFCFKKSNLKLAAAAIDEPEMLKDWLDMTNNASNRNKRGSQTSANMYRNYMAITDVIAIFEGSTGDEIKSRIRGSKMIDTNSCSESCEIF